MDIQHIFHKLKPHATLNNAVLLVALMIVIASVWNTLSTLQKNFVLQQKVNKLNQEIEITRLEADNLKLQQEYYRSEEYIKLTAKAKLGKAEPGEVMVVLPPLPEIEPKSDPVTRPTATSNFSKWIQLLFGHRTTAS